MLSSLQGCFTEVMSLRQYRVWTQSRQDRGSVHVMNMRLLTLCPPRLSLRVLNSSDQTSQDFIIDTATIALCTSLTASVFLLSFAVRYPGCRGPPTKLPGCFGSVEILAPTCVRPRSRQFCFYTQALSSIAIDAPGLMALPVELLQHICAYITPERLPVARLSCRSMCNASFDAFADEYLDDLHCYVLDPARLNRIDASPATIWPRAGCELYAQS